jgi:hypothetical protein
MIACLKLLNVVQDGECHGGEWECLRCSKEIKKQQTYKLKPCETGETISSGNALDGWQGRKLWLVWPCSRCLSSMELLLAAIIGISFAYLVVSVMYDE